ncbi:uncharacterized protein LOC119168211 isoform X2 [Rhipicephalus microplus]|uniref:uncharacterized protein LOC119168211 isoform X2 n=2 Tax=Rhipicephalus microplus TaxID=6941 RepID=UPI003F6D1195
MVQSLEHWCPATGIPLRPTSPPRPTRRLASSQRYPQAAETGSQPGRRAPTPWMSSATTSKNGDWGEQAGSSGAEDNERQVQPSAEESYRPAARPNLVQELAARTGCAVSASGSESGVSPSSSMGDVPPFAPAPSPAGSAPPCSSYLLQQLASSCSFPNSLDGVQSTCHSSPCGGPASSMQLRSSPSAAASFFARAAQRLNLSSKRRRRHGGGSATADGSQSAADGPVFVTRYAELLRDSPPAVPPALLRGLSRKDTGLGKVKVMLRVCPAAASGGESSSSCSTPSHSPAHEPGTSVGGASSFLQLDSRKKQVTLYDPTASGGCGGSADRASSGDEATTPSSPSSAPARLTGVAAPKMFAFDAVFSQDATQAEVCSSALTELVQAVVNGTDACLFVYGPAGLGKTWTMLGSGSSQELGAIPCAVSWLFRLIDEHKQRTGARFSVRVSAVQVAGRSEHLRDLLAEQANGTEGSGTAPGLYLRDDPILGTKLMNYSELRAPTAEKAAFLLDAAVAAAAAANQRSESESRNRHFLFTLHVYQYRVDKSGRGGVAGGRSRLHLFDLGSCERGTKAGGPLSLSALGNVILALFNAQKRLPFRESKVTQLLKEALGSVTCRAAMIAHVSPLSANYAETLATIQLASRMHRMRRKKLKYGSTMASAAADGVEGVCRPFMRTQALNEEGSGPRSGSSDPEYTSSSEQSCDTVIYVGRHQDFTDNEGPPPALEAVLSAPTPQNSPARTVTSKPAESPSRHGGSSSALGPAAITRTDAPTPSKSGATNRDACSSPSAAESHGKAHHTLKKSHRGTGGSNAPTKDPPVTSASTASHDAAGGSRRASDELWIDGPRFSKPRFDSRTLDQLQKEQWVDGPAVAAAVYGYMDDHKKNMVERWVQEHSRYAQGHKGAKKHRPASANRTETEPSPKSTPEHRKTRTHHEHHSKRRTSLERCHVNGGCSREQHHERKTAHDTFSSEQQQHAPKSVKCAPAKRDQGQNTSATTATREEVAPCHDVHMTPAEEEQPESPVHMQDCCLQVTEEDILAATSGWPATNDENPLPEVDQGSSKNGAGSGSQGSHPLRVLSDDGLNLPSSFTDSRSVSVDLNHVVGDDAEILGHVYGGLTWKLLQGTLLQRRRERHQRLYGDDLSVGVKGDVLTEKLERIARLRKLTSPYFDNNNERIPSLLIMRSGTSSPTGGRYGSLPNRKQRKDLCDDHDGSTDDGSNSDCADVTSTKSEPADLDAADRYDIQRLNIKPMNGLKLEAFYNRIQKSNSSLAESQDLSPPKLSPQGDTLFQSYSEKLDLLAKDFGVFPGAHDPPVIDVQPHRLFPLLNASSEPDGLSANHRVPPQGTEAPPPDSSPPEASGDCVSPAACSFARQPRWLSSGGPSEDVAARLAQNGDHVEKSTSKPNRVLANGTRTGSSTQQHVKQEQHSSPKRVIASGSKPQRKLSSGSVPIPGAAVTLAHKIHMSPSRAAASPTNSACGTLTSCCSPTRSRASAKNGRTTTASATPAAVITKAPCSNGKHCDPARLAKKPPHGSKLSPVGAMTALDGGDPTSATNNPLCRSVSTPTTPCSAIDSKSAIQRAETVDSGVLPSPYATVTQARPTIRKSSSGHGSSDSSSFKGVMKTVQVVQCSGTSSGYESIILRDSTPASSQDSGSERGNKEARGRKGSRKMAQVQAEEPAAGADRRRAEALPRAHPCEGVSTCRDSAGTCSAGTSSTDTICAGDSPKTKWAVLAFCAAGFWTSTRRHSRATSLRTE